MIDHIVKARSMMDIREIVNTIKKTLWFLRSLAISDYVFLGTNNS